MSENPLHKTRGPKQPGPVLRNNRGRGEINISKDYSTIFTSRRSRIAYIGLCSLLYAAFCIFLYAEGLAVLAIFMLSIALLMFLLVWALQKYAG